MTSLNLWLKHNLFGKNGFILGVTLFLITLPLTKLAYNNVALIFLIVITACNYKNISLHKNQNLIFPIAYFILGSLSIIWSIDFDLTLKALFKIICLLILPVLFLYSPNLEKKDFNKILNFYSHSMVLYSVYLLLKAFFRYIETKDHNVFFYHELVTLEVNAIYISIIFSIAFLIIISKKNRNIFDYLSSLILFISIVLLSSKNIIVVTLLLSILSFFVFRSKLELKKVMLFFVLISLGCIPFSHKIIERFEDEFVNIRDHKNLENGVENVSIKNAWEQEKFTQNNYFSGTSLRVYQLRLLKEFIDEDPNILLLGDGLNASQKKIIAKQKERGYQEYYGQLNFHNQYLQSIAELGLIGLALILIMIALSLFKAIKNKDYNFLCFIILIGNLCITESIFSRQRGISMFIIFYCLYNRYSTQEKIK